MIKKFYNEKDLAEYLNASKQYVNNEIHDFIDYEYASIYGEVKDGEVVINDNAAIYDSRG